MSAFSSTINGGQSWRAGLYQLLLREALPADKFGHQPRLYALTRQVGHGLNYDDDVVYAAAYLHDLGVFLGNRTEDPDLLPSWDHVAYAVGRAPGILQELGFPEHKIEPVLAAIRTHQPRDTPGSPEAVVLRDADMLEQLGAVAICRMMAKVGRDTRYSLFSHVVPELERALERLPTLMQLETTRRLAQPRLHALRDFLDALASEVPSDLTAM